MKKFTLNPLALLITTSFALSANAEEVSAENAITKKVAIEEKKIEKIYIRGTKQELTLQEVDASVELFTTERLDAERIVDLNDALIRIPNVSSTGSTGSITIRGISRSGASGAGQGVTSNVYVDGSPLSGGVLTRSLASIWDTQQVEVLRGSQSSVQGRNALSGTIVITTADPTYDPEGKFRLTYAEDNTYQIAGAYGNKLIDDQLAFRLAADYQKSDGYIDHINADRNADFEKRLLLRGKLLFEPKAIDDLTIKLTVDHADNDTGETRKTVNTSSVGSNVTDAAFADFDVFDFNSSGRFVQNNVQSTRVILDTYYDLSDHWSINSILTHENTKIDRQFGFEGRIAEFDLFAFNQTDEEVNTAELRFTFDYDTISGVIGGYYFDNQTDQNDFSQVQLAVEVADATQGFGSISTPDALLTNNSFEDESVIDFAFFAQIRAQLTSALTLDLGLRYDNETFNTSGLIGQANTVDNESCLATVPGAIFPNGSGIVTLPCATLIELAVPVTDEIPQAAKFKAWLPKATLTYQINDDHSVFASAQRGYRAGGSFITSEVDLATLDSTSEVRTYEPEFLNTVEIGSRSVFADGDVILNTNIFYSTYKDQQINLPGNNVTSTADDEIVNAAESTIYGAEIATEYFITQAWDVYASLGLLKTEFDDFEFATQGEFTNLAGNEQPGSANVTASIGVNWVGQNGLFANVNAFYTGKRFSGIENLDNGDLFAPAVAAGVSESVASTLTEEVNAYVNVNARFGYELDNFTLYAFVTNIFDEEVIISNNFTNVSQISGNVQFSSDGTITTVLPARSFGIGIDYSF